MVYIKIVIPYAPLTMTILDVFLYFKSQTGNQVISVDETIIYDLCKCTKLSSYI